MTQLLLLNQQLKIQNLELKIRAQRPTLFFLYKQMIISKIKIFFKRIQILLLWIRKRHWSERARNQSKRPNPTPNKHAKFSVILFA
ncbi:hypothetical protein LNTAR_17683 [Lentisphaera araneosa HTCC2155]|jgi:hypothetical protein|uniref:Uncharacterized protein n=1 Tax=Lentisphaera araneosa HTCC2155 TaxID=313628 RepID=A6DFM5_9BACT|nr:hypothetical protein LNTAR_17683 [Lentisphaera araneosa HTCC2155]